MKPFRISANWIYYGFQPASENPSNTMAIELMDLAEDAAQSAPGGWDTATISTTDPDLVEEIVSVSELFTRERGDQGEDRQRGQRAQSAIKRGKAWLDDYAEADHTRRQEADMEDGVPDPFPRTNF